MLQTDKHVAANSRAAEDIGGHSYETKAVD